MKYFIFLSLASSILFSCSTGTTEESNDGPDTLKTESGLQYYYLNKGEGRKVEYGSKMSSYLSLMVNDSVVWNTDESPDSVFTFIVGVDPVIQGFEEMAMLMREGDDVVAILPSDLAYGERGAGDVIPPNATLVYDRFDARQVDEPKAILRDTLIAKLEEGFDVMISKYVEITTTADSSNYHLGTGEARRVWSKLRSDERYEEALRVLEYFETVSPWEGIDWSRVLTYENLEQFEVAIRVLEGIIESDTSGWEGYRNKLEELKGRIE